MINNTKIYFGPLLIFMLFMGTLSFSQKMDTLEVHRIKGKDYYIHVAEKGNTLYSIHKLYDVPLEVIKKENPSVLDGISLGEKIFIPVKKNPTDAKMLNGNYIQHLVQKKETLYGIAKLYRIKERDILSANPSLEGLKEGEYINIPVQKIKDAEVPKKREMERTHWVEQGETIYALTKLYGISEQELKMANDGLENGLKAGETILLPKSASHPSKVQELEVPPLPNRLVSSVDSVAIKSVYHIGLMLPFYLDKNEEIAASLSSKNNIYPQSKFAIEFYNGVLMALDSISSDSVQFKLHPYDTRGTDTLTTIGILKKEELKNFDLIIGPLYSHNFNRAAGFARRYGIPIVSPVKQHNKILLGNNFVFKAIPSPLTIVQKVADLVADKFKTENLIAIKYGGAPENYLVDAYVKKYRKSALRSSDTADFSMVNILNIHENFDDVVSAFRMGKKNVIFVPTNNRMFVTKLFNELTNALSGRMYEDYEVVLLGTEEWLNFENIDLEYFHKLNVHLALPQYIDYDDPQISNFSRDYYSKTTTYPSKSSFLGFDLTYYFASNLKLGRILGKGFKSSNQQSSIELDFFKTGLESGYENGHAFLLRFSDYNLLPAER